MFLSIAALSMAFLGTKNVMPCSMGQLVKDPLVDFHGVKGMSWLCQWVGLGKFERFCNRGSDVCSITLPTAIMSFWTVLSCCFTTPKPSSQPIKTVSLNKLRVSALMDTGSTVTLIDSKLKKDILLKGSNPARGPILKLCGADGKELQNDSYYSIQITITRTSFGTT